MGIPRPKRLPNGTVKRAGIMLARREFELAPGVEVAGLTPRLLVRVAAFTCKLRNKFEQLCKKHGIHAIGVEYHGAVYCLASPFQAVTYDCIGTVEALEALVGEYYVQEWTYMVSATVGHTASGSGPEKVRATPGKAGKGCKGDASANFSRDGADKTERAMARDGFLGKEFIP